MTLPVMNNQKTPVGNKTWKCIPQTNAKAQILQGLMFQNNSNIKKRKQKFKSQLMLA